MTTEVMPQLGVRSVCAEVLTLDGDAPTCENCLTQLGRRMPETAPPDRDEGA